MSRTAYIAGKITGLPKDQVKRKFNMITTKLSSMGYHVEHPVGVNDDEPTWNQAIRSHTQ